MGVIKHIIFDNIQNNKQRLNTLMMEENHPTYAILYFWHSVERILILIPGLIFTNLEER